MGRTFLATGLLAGVVLIGLAGGARGLSSQGEKARRVPAPTVETDLTQNPRSSDVAVFAGGCFWGVQGVYQRVKGVTRAVSGYAGGNRNTAEYDLVTTGRTGHAESVEVTFDPRVVSYGTLLQVFFSVVHDPTQLNRQGPDEGTQYRSAIFPRNDDQARVAKAYLLQLNAAKVFRTGIATTIEPDRVFYPAEPYHQDYLTLNPRAPYIVFNDLPKIEDLKRFFPDLYRAEPVLVGQGR